MKKTDPLAAENRVTKELLRRLPLIMHQRIGLQEEIAHWAETDLENLNVAATYNVVHGNPLDFVIQGLGYFLTTRDMLPPDLTEGICFLPLEPALPPNRLLSGKSMRCSVRRRRLSKKLLTFS